MTQFDQPIQEQYATTYRRAEAEPGVLCMIATYDHKRALELMAQAVQRYADQGVVAKMDVEKMNVYLPNGSYVHYGVSKSSQQ